ncbi:MAG: hypothetical protein ABC550_03865, partial [Candidatus Methanosuratincola petrocarbonis]
LDQSAVDSISQTILLPVSLQPYDLLALPEGFASAKAALASGGDCRHTDKLKHCIGLCRDQ